MAMHEISGVKYQVLPDLPRWQYNALKMSIKRWGVLMPVVKDELGNTIDGYQRERICRELGITNYPVIVLSGLTADEKRDHALILNLVRRRLSRKQMRQVIAAELRRTPDLASNYLAEILGTSDKTVESVRQELIATSGIPKLEKLRGKDGKQRKVARIVTSTAKELEKAIEIVQDLPANCSGKTLDIRTAKRRAAKNKNERERQGRTVQPLPDDAIRLYHSPFQELEDMAGLAAASTNLVLTDIPYGQDFLEQVEELAAFAQRILVEGGLFVTLCGQYWLYKVMDTLSRHLTYRWLNASVWNGAGTPIHIGGWKEPHARIISKWKPLLVYSKGGFPRRGQWCDVFNAALSGNLLNRDVALLG